MTTFNIAKIQDKKNVARIIKETVGAGKRYNNLMQYAIIGASYHVVNSGNTNFVREIMDTIKHNPRAVRFAQIQVAITAMTGGMIQFKDALGNELKDGTFKYKFDQEAKDWLIGDENQNPLTSQYAKEAQIMWYDRKKAKVEEAKYDAAKAQEMLAKYLKNFAKKCESNVLTEELLEKALIASTK